LTDGRGAGSAGISDAGLEAEFDAVTAPVGIRVPADLKGGVLRGYRGIRTPAMSGDRNQAG
jgi:hypothetical protein